MDNTTGGLSTECNRFCICMLGKENNDNENAKWILCNGYITGTIYNAFYY